MNLVTIRTEELEGGALHWAVAKAVCPPSFSQSVNPHSGLSFWSEGYLGGLTKDPALTAFELITRLNISINAWWSSSDEDKCESGREWYAYAPEKRDIQDGRTHITTFQAFADNPATAIFRSTVILLLGQEVQVPEDLVGVKNGYLCKLGSISMCLEAAGYDECDLMLIQVYAVTLMAITAYSQRIKSQSAPSGASRSFDYSGDVKTMRNTLAALDKSGCTAELPIDVGSSVGFFDVVGGC